MQKDVILKDINFCGYYDETKKYVIEIDKESAIKLLARALIRESKTVENKENVKEILQEVVKNELEADIVEIRG